MSQKSLSNPKSQRFMSMFSPRSVIALALTVNSLIHLKKFYIWCVVGYSLEKTLMLGNVEGRRRRGLQRMRWLMASPTWWTWVWASSGSWWWTGKPDVLQSTGLKRVWHHWATKLNWNEIQLHFFACGYPFIEKINLSFMYTLFFFFATTHSMWDLSSSSQHEPVPPAVEA